MSHNWYTYKVLSKKSPWGRYKLNGSRLFTLFDHFMKQPIITVLNGYFLMTIYSRKQIYRIYKQGSKRFWWTYRTMTKFPSRFNYRINNPAQLDLLEDEFKLYKSMSEHKVPDNMWEESVERFTDGRSYHWMATVCKHLRKSLPKLLSIAYFF